MNRDVERKSFSETENDSIFVAHLTEHTFADEAPNPVFRVDRHGRVVYGNPSCDALFSCWRIAVGDRLPVLWLDRLEVTIAKEVCEVFEESCGETIYSLTFVPILKNGYVNVYAHDISGLKITERKLIEHEQQLLESRLMLQRVIDLMPVRVFWKDRESIYLGCNLAFAKDAGHESPEDLVGLNDYQLAWKDFADDYRDDDRLVIRSASKKLNYEEMLGRSNGDPAWIKTSKVPLTDLDGQVVGVLGVYEDITRKKKAAEELEVHRRNLEGMVEERTSELRKIVNLMASRENRMSELKEMIRKLGKQLKENGINPVCEVEVVKA